MRLVVGVLPIMSVILTGAMVSAADADSGSETPEFVTRFAREYCLHCHGASVAKGDFRLDQLPWNLTDTKTREHWKLVRDYVADGDMPAKNAPRQPDAPAVKKFIAGLDADFARADRLAKPGGTVIRRLNRIEYLNTVRDLFGIRMIKLPASFPEDAPQTEFDTMPKGLLLSPAVMEAYHDVATDIANRIVPLPGVQKYQSAMTVEEIGGDANRRWFGPDRNHLMFTGVNHSGWAGALWDALFVAPESGAYRVRLLARAQAATGADDQPLRLTFYAFDPTEEQLPKRYLRHRAAQAGSVDVRNTEFQWIECNIQIEAGETFHVYCGNRFETGTYPALPLNRGQVNQHVKSAKERTDPTIELREMKIDGPVDVTQRVKEFFDGYPPKLSHEELEHRLLPLADRAYRRPLTEDEKRQLTARVLEHGRRTGSSQLAWHYGIRRILCSPAFLYREADPALAKRQPTELAAGPSGSDNHAVGAEAGGFRSQGRPLNSHALASRLSYTLWSTMPDGELRRLADRDLLSDPGVLTKQIRRLIADPRSSQFVKHFTGQWLGNRTVESINICDNRYPWHDTVRYGFVRSTEMFFEEVLRENLPIAAFIDSDFTYANNAMLYVWGFRGKAHRGLDRIAADQRQSLIWPEPRRLSLLELPQGSPAHVKDRGGILGLPGVLTVSGDGVESSPILRGVWVLENMFGKSPPPPPKNVPALDVDTSNARGVREILTAHRKLETCASCHRDIDPLGLALENYDAIGGWREAYAGSAGPIDASAVMPDGTPLNGAGSIKAYLLEHRDLFTRCLLTKLLEYGSGRELSWGDRKVVDTLVAAEPESGYLFRDLLEAALTSDVFLTK